MTTLPKNNDDREDKIDALEYAREWRRCLIWQAIQAGLCLDAARITVYNDMLYDECVLKYHRVFPEFRQQVWRVLQNKKAENL